MTGHGLTRSALVVSTTPPIPREYGNRNRVFQTIEFLRDAGFKISFLLYPFDEEWSTSIPSYYHELVDEFEYFAVIPNSRQLHQNAAGYHHGIDEWWDDTIGQHLAWLFGRKKFDVLFVNYTFLSKAFDFAPKSVMRLLDTHDLFTERRETFERYGVAAEFFYTNAEQEKIAFDRADAIIAIKASEAELIRTLTDKFVVTISYWDSGQPQDGANPRRGDLAFSHDRPLRAGFIGAQNSVNVVNMRRFLHTFDRYVRLYDLPVEIVVAGNVCRQLHTDYPFLRKLGRIPSVDDFYRDVDVILAPLEFSTGIKIKVGEALSRQLPVMATQNAFDGFRPFHETQSEASVATLCQSLASLATNEISYTQLAMAARRSALAAAKAQEKGFSDLRAWIKAHMRRVVVITDRPFWFRGNFLDELVTQTIEFVSHITRLVVIAITPGPIDATQVYASAEFVPAENVGAAASVFGELGGSCTVAGAVLCLGRSNEAAFQVQAARLGIASLGLRVDTTRGTPVAFHTDSRPAPIAVAPLRYAPLASRKDLDPRRVALFRPSNMTDWQALLIRHVEDRCAAHGLTAVAIDVPPYAEFDAQFLLRSVDDAAGKLVMFDTDHAARLFALQAASYRQADCLVIGETFVSPEVVAADDATPSLQASIENFLDRRHGTLLAASGDTGWSEVWSVLQPG